MVNKNILEIRKKLDKLDNHLLNLIKERENLQKKIDNWHIKNKGNEINLKDYKKFFTNGSIYNDWIGSVSEMHELID